MVTGLVTGCYGIAYGMVLALYCCVIGFAGGSVVKNLLANAGDTSLIPGSGQSLGEGNGNPLQYSCLENLRDRGTWWANAMGSQRVRRDLVTKQQ